MSLPAITTSSVLAAWPSPVTPPSFEEGMRHYWGDGALQDLRAAVRCFEKAVKEGDPRAFGKLGRCLLYGDGCSRDIGRALEILAQGEALDDEESRVLFAVCLMYGIGIQKDEVRSIQLLRKGLEQCNGMCCQALAYFTYKGIGVPKNEEIARTQLEMGIALKCMCYSEELEPFFTLLFGKCSEQDDIRRYKRFLGKNHPVPIQSVHILKDGARVGDGACMFRLALAYWNGNDGLARDRRMAVHWLHQSIQAPFHQDKYAALNWLSHAYQTGDGVAQDIQYAKWLLFQLVELGGDPSVNSYSMVTAIERDDIVELLSRPNLPFKVEFS